MFTRSNVRDPEFKVQSAEMNESHILSFVINMFFWKLHTLL